MEKGLEIIKNFSEKFSNTEELAEALRREYTELFLIPPKPPVSLYEAHYSGEKATHVLLRLNDFYRKAGLQKAKEYREREDHLALELEFMYILCEKKSKLKREFLAHLNSWVPKAMDEIISNHRAEFYLLVACKIPCVSEGIRKGWRAGKLLICYVNNTLQVYQP